MLCPTCGSDRNEILRTIPGAMTIRRRVCLDCESRWTSDEVMRPGSLWRKGDPIPTNAGPPLPVSGSPATGNGLVLIPAATRIGRVAKLPATGSAPLPRGVGGVLPSGQVRDLVLIPSGQEISRTKGSKRRRSLPRTVYPVEFEAEWGQTAKTGSKDKACTLWEKLGRPPFGASWKRWEVCPEWSSEWHSFPHVRTWLGDGRYLQDPTEARARPVTESGLSDLEKAARQLSGRDR